MTIESASAERVVIAYSDEQAVFVPGSMNQLRGRGLDLDNALTGLAWYQAFNNDRGPFTPTERAKLLLDIFNPAELVNLSGLVEMQTGVSGLIESVCLSYSWAEWKLFPFYNNVTESLSIKPSINVGVSVDKNGLAAVSFRHDFDPEAERYEICDPKLKVYKEWDELHPDDDYHSSLPDFELRRAEVRGRRIILEGTEYWGDEESLTEPERLFMSYVLTEWGQLEFEDHTRVDPRIERRLQIGDAEGKLVKFNRDANFDRQGVGRLINSDPYSMKSLAHFLLPYCDRPTTDGHYYVLPAEMVND